MGHKHSTSKEFEDATRKHTVDELRELETLYQSLAAQSQSDGKYVIASVFQNFYGIHGRLGARLFDLATSHRQDGQLTYEDFILLKAKYEKSSPRETEEFLFALVDLFGDGHVTRTDIEAVVLSALKTVVGPETKIPDSSLQALLQSATFSEKEKPTKVPTTSGQGEERQADGAEACMTFEDFHKWCGQLPSLKKYLCSLLNPPSDGGAGAAGRSIPELVAPAEVSRNLLLRREYAWYIAGMLQDKDSKEWTLLFQSDAHGLSFNTFIGRVSVFKGPTVILVKDKQGAIFGGLASQPWERHSDFYGDMKSFLFTLNPTMALHRPSGTNANIQWCASGFVSESIPNGVGFGGQVGHFGLFLGASLDNGQSRPSVTFNSPILSSQPDFVPDVVECWAVVSEPKGQEGAEGQSSALKGTILERFKEDRAMLNLVGIAGAHNE